MEAWRRELRQNELLHYGVKGMKWGEHKFGLDEELDPDAAKRESDDIESQLINLVYSGRQGGTRSYSSNTSSETKKILNSLKEAKAKEYRARIISGNSRNGSSNISENEYKAVSNSAMKEAEKYVSQLVKDYEIDTSDNYDDERMKKAFAHGELYHYGTKHHSGRYPYGSGDRPYQDKEEARAEKYRAGEIKKLDARYKKKVGRLSEKSYKLYKRHDQINSDSRSYQDSNVAGRFPKKVYTDKAAREVHSIVNKRTKLEAKIAAYKDVYEREVEHVKNMSISDISDERIAIGKSVVKRAAVGTFLFGAAGGAAGAASATSAENKTRIRLNEKPDIKKMTKQNRLDLEGYSYAKSGLDAKQSRKLSRYVRESDAKYKTALALEKADESARIATAEQYKKARDSRVESKKKITVDKANQLGEELYKKKFGKRLPSSPSNDREEELRELQIMEELNKKYTW